MDQGEKYKEGGFKFNKQRETFRRSEHLYTRDEPDFWHGTLHTFGDII